MRDLNGLGRTALVFSLACTQWAELVEEDWATAGRNRTLEHIWCRIGVKLGGNKIMTIELVNYL